MHLQVWCHNVLLWHHRCGQVCIMLLGTSWECQHELVGFMSFFVNKTHVDHWPGPMRMLSHNRFCMFEKQAKYCTKMEEEKMGIVVFVLFFIHIYFIQIFPEKCSLSVDRMIWETITTGRSKKQPIKLNLV